MGKVYESGASGVCTKDSFQGLLMDLSESGKKQKNKHPLLQKNPNRTVFLK